MARMSQKVSAGDQGAVRLVGEVRDQYDSEWAAIAWVAAKLGIGTPETLRKWPSGEVDAGRRPGVTNDESAELRRLWAEVRELQRSNEPAAAGRAVGCRLHVCQHVGRHGLRGVRARRVLPPHPRLARRVEPAHRPGPRRVGDGDLDPCPRRRRRPHRTGGTPRRGVAIHVDSLHRTARRGWRRTIGRQRRRRLRQPLAESEIGLFRTEVIRARGPRRSLDDVEVETLEWVDWHNHRRLQCACCDLTPAEYEQVH